MKNLAKEGGTVICPDIDLKISVNLLSRVLYSDTLRQINFEVHSRNEL
jgi:hypothetical protein